MVIYTNTYLTILCLHIQIMCVVILNIIANKTEFGVYDGWAVLCTHNIKAHRIQY